MRALRHFTTAPLLALAFETAIPARGCDPSIVTDEYRTI